MVEALQGQVAALKAMGRVQSVTRLRTMRPEVLLEAVRAVARGERYLSNDVRKVFERKSPDAERAIISELSAREFEVFRLLAQGHSAGECANLLNLSQKTVANYQALIKEKLGVGTSAALVHLALRLGMVTQIGPEQA